MAAPARRYVCRALIVPSVEEFGITTVQAQASGRPVIRRGRRRHPRNRRRGRDGLLLPGGRRRGPGEHPALRRPRQAAPGRRRAQLPALLRAQLPGRIREQVARTRAIAVPGKTRTFANNIATADPYAAPIRSEARLNALRLVCAAVLLGRVLGPRGARSGRSTPPRCWFRQLASRSTRRCAARSARRSRRRQASERSSRAFPRGMRSTRRRSSGSSPGSRGGTVGATPPSSLPAS